MLRANLLCRLRSSCALHFSALRNLPCPTTETALKANFVFAELNESQLDSMVLAFERQKVILVFAWDMSHNRSIIEAFLNCL
jgi:hypothetical protein